MKNLSILKRGGVFLLAAIMVIAYMPLFGTGPVYASDDEYKECEEIVDVLTAEQKQAEKDKAEAKVLAEMGVTDDSDAAAAFDGEKVMSESAAFDGAEAMSESAASQPEEDLDALPGTADSISDMKIGRASENGGIPRANRSAAKKLDDPDLDPDPEPEPEPEPPEYPANENIKVKTLKITSYGDVVMSAEVNETGWTFSRLCLDDADDTVYDASIEGLTSFNTVFSLRDYDIGYHTLILRLCYNGEETDGFYYWTKFASLPYGEAPSIRYADFATGKNYFKYYNRGNYYSRDSGCGVAIEYKKGKGSWKQGPASVSSYYEKKKSGLSPASTYSVRARYSKAVTYDYDGKTYLFVGPVSRALKIKTAYKKPKVKKVKITKVKVKCKKYKYWTGRIKQRWLVNARTGQKIKLLKQWKIYRTVRSYTTKYKVTVKFKKKQGIAGIQLRTSHGYDVWLGGNKKSYSKTFTVSGKKKGKKLKVSVKCRMSKKYDSWSGAYKKKVKIK